MLDHLRDSEVSPYRFNAFVSALAFLEVAGGRSGGEVIHNHPLVRSMLAESLAVSPHEPRPSRQALRLPAGAVVALERLVTDEDQLLYHRLTAWFRLLKVWGALRTDDHRGLPPGSVDMGARGLSALLTRTKTSGPDKCVQQLAMWISPQAYLFEPQWLPIGWELWRDQGLSRD